MRKAFVIVPSGVEVDPTGDHDIALVTETIISRTVIILTRQCVGEGVVIAGRIITSAFLVKDEVMVSIVLPRSRRAQAVVARRDDLNHIAELKPVSLVKGDRTLSVSSGEARVNTGPIGSIGAPLLLADVASGTPAVSVAGMSYVIRVSERREDDAWKILQHLPAGIAGGGIWNIDGEFVGLSLATKKPHFAFERDLVLALPAEEVMNFAETN